MHFTLSPGLIDTVRVCKSDPCETLRHYTAQAVFAEILNQV